MGIGTPVFNAEGCFGTASEGNGVSLEQIECLSEWGNAGIEFTKFSDLINVRSCQFIECGSFGVKFSDDVNRQTIIDCVFADVQTGILFDGYNMTVRKIEIANNSFDQLKTGIEFKYQPNTLFSGDIKVS